MPQVASAKASAVKKILVLSILFGFICGMLIAVSKTRAQTFDADNFVFPRITAEDKAAYEKLKFIEEMVDEYNKKQNEYMNSRIKALVTSAPEELAKIDVLPPLGENGLRGECPKEEDGVVIVRNVTTLCVARAMSNEFFTFKAALEGKAGEMTGEAINNAKEAYKEKGIDNPKLSFGDVSVQVTSNIGRIEREIGIAENALELSLATYNELHMAFPLHLKYEELIGVIEDYRDAIADIRSEIYFYPATFHNVTTPECT